LNLPFTGIASAAGDSSLSSVGTGSSTIGLFSVGDLLFSC
jgi:hypothetical protein